MEKTKYYKKTLNKITEELDTSTSEGLTILEAKRRKKEYGKNTIEKTKNNNFTNFIKQLITPFSLLLITGLVISLILNNIIDASIISIILLTNLIINFTQDIKDEDTNQILNDKINSKAKVIRNGHIKEINSENIVPGDILLLEKEDKIPVDARIIDSENLKTDEEELTGKNSLVEKTNNEINNDKIIAERKNMVFAGTTVKEGKAKAIVTSTGMKTQLGNIATKINESSNKTNPIKQKVKEISRWSAIIAVITTLIILSYGFITGGTWNSILSSITSLTIASVPEGLPLVITLALTFGVRNLSKENTVVKKLNNIISLGSTSTICTNHKGVITHGEKTVEKIWVDQVEVNITGKGYNPSGVFTINERIIDYSEFETLQELLKTGIMCNNTGNNRSDEEKALSIIAEKADLNENKIRDKKTIIDESSEDKITTKIFENEDGTKKSYSKCDPKKILENSNRILIDGKIRRLNRKRKKEVLNGIKEFSQKNLEIIGFSYNEKVNQPENNIFLGLQAMKDPIREDIKESINKSQEADTDLKIFTGHDKRKAEEIKERLELGKSILTGEEINKSSDKELQEKVKETSIFTGLDTHNKLEVIEALQSNEEKVTMFGDSLKDIPALKKSDSGVSSNNSDIISQEASDIKIENNNFNTLFNLISKSQKIYNNVRKKLSYLLSANMSELGVIITLILFGLPLALTTILLLSINSLIALLPSITLNSNDELESTNSRESIYQEYKNNLIGYPAIVIILSCILFTYTYWNSNLLTAQTTVFSMIAISQSFQSLSINSKKESFYNNLSKNRYLILSVIGSLAITTSIIYVPYLRNIFNTVPLSIAELSVITALSIIPYIYLEISKK